MIEVKLQLRGEQVATLRVEDGRAWVSGRAELFDTRVPVIDRAEGRQVRFDEDPEAWARNLDTTYRTPYLVPVTVADTHPNPPPERPARARIEIPDVPMCRGSGRIGSMPGASSESEVEHRDATARSPETPPWPDDAGLERR